MKLPEGVKWMDIPTPWLLPNFTPSECERNCGNKCVFERNSCIYCCCDGRSGNPCGSCGEVDLNDI